MKTQRGRCCKRSDLGKSNFLKHVRATVRLCFRFGALFFFVAESRPKPTTAQSTWRPCTSTVGPPAAPTKLRRSSSKALRNIWTTAASRSRWRRQFAMTSALRCRGAAMGRPSVVPGDRPRFPSVVPRQVSHQLPRAHDAPLHPRAEDADQGPHHSSVVASRAPLPAAFPASNSSTEARCISLWSTFSTTPDPDVVAAGDQFCCSIHDAAWLPGVRHATSVTCQNAHTLDTLMPQASQEDRTSIKLRQVPGAEPGQWRARLLLFECDADLIPTPPLHPPPRPGHAVGVARFSTASHAAVCPCEGHANGRHNAVAHVFYYAAQEAGIRPQKKKEQGSSSHAQTSTDFARGPAPNLPPTCKPGISRTPPAAWRPETLVRGRLRHTTWQSTRLK